MQHRLVAVHRGPLPWTAGVVGIAACSWLVMIAFSVTGRGAVVRHDQLILGSLPLWQATLLFAAGWQVMLWAMMVPASAHAFARQPAPHLFMCGYLLAWTAFGLAAFFFDVGVHATVNHSPWLAEHPWLIAGTTLALVGAYQLSDLKTRSLVACRRLTPGPNRNVHVANGTISAGLGYGVKCLGANWGLMLLAFAIGAGSLAFMGAITAAMVWEVTPLGSGTVKLIGYALLAAGVVVLAGPIQ
jgi:predicted metal-binding membrane protein